MELWTPPSGPSRSVTPQQTVLQTLVGGVFVYLFLELIASRLEKVLQNNPPIDRQRIKPLLLLKLRSVYLFRDIKNVRQMSVLSEGEGLFIMGWMGKGKKKWHKGGVRA